MGLASPEAVRLAGRLETQQGLTLQSWGIDDGIGCDELPLTSTKYSTTLHFQETPQRPTWTVFKLCLVCTTLDMGRRGFGPRFCTSHHLSLVFVTFPMKVWDPLGSVGLMECPTRTLCLLSRSWSTYPRLDFFALMAWTWMVVSPKLYHLRMHHRHICRGCGQSICLWAWCSQSSREVLL